jgi:hypothetical protein
MPRDKSSKRLDRKKSDYKERPYKNSLADASLFLNPDSARDSALTLHGCSDYDKAIEKAFDDFGLDPSRPHHWRRLLGILADVFFGERCKGPKPRWDSEAIKQLILDFDHLSATLPPKTNQMIQFELLISRKPKRYAGLRPSTLKARYNEGKRRFGR